MKAAPRKGFVLVCVLWVLAILTVLVIGFGHRAVLRNMGARYELEHTQAMMMARGAVQRGLVEIGNKMIKDMAQSRNPGVTKLGQEWAQRKDMFTDGKYFTSTEELEGDEVWYQIEDCERYINLNTLGQEAYRPLLENIPTLDRSDRRRISRHLNEGVHDKEPRAFFQCAEELRYFEGVNDKDWFGTKDKPGLKDLLTTYGEGRINVNTAPRAVLLCVPGLDEGSVDLLLAFRNGADRKPGTSDDQGFDDFFTLGQKTGMEGDPLRAIERYCIITSSYFKIRGVATRQGGKVRATCTAVVYMERDERTHAPQVLAWQENALGS